MAKSLPPLGWLRAFEAAARTLSFTSAAEELGLTQSAISQQVKSLETRLGAPLFLRHARGLTLTDAGRRLLPEVEAPLQQLATALTGMETGPATNLLTIATSVSVAHWVIAPRLPAFRTRFPHLRLRLLSAIWPDDFHSVRSDIEIRFGSARQAGPGAEQIAPNRLIAVKGAGLDGDMATLPLIEAVGTSSGWQAWSAQVCEVPPAQVFTDTYGMALHLAAHGGGIALVNEWIAGHAIRSGQVTRVDPASIPSKEGYHLSIRPGLPEAAALRAVLLD